MTPRKKLIDQIEDLLREILFLERGKKCEICGSTCKLGLFHILPKGRYPRIRFHKDNLLIAGWFCCHLIFHKDFYISRDRIVPRIKELRGGDYEYRLKTIDTYAPKITMTYLNILLKALRKELKALEKKW